MLLSKPSITSAAPEPRSKSEPTRLIVRCCEQRKIRAGQIALLAETQRIRVKVEQEH